MQPKIRKTCFWSMTVYLGILVMFAAAQGQTAGQRPTDPRMDDINKLKEYNRILDGQEKDRAAERTKEQRLALVNEAFRRIQMLHNEMITMISAKDAPDPKKIVSTAEEVKLRASELNSNLALPQIAVEKEKQKKTEAETTRTATATEYMSAMCILIRDLVKNVNLSSTDPKAGIQARRELVALIERSDDLLLTVSAASKP